MLTITPKEFQQLAAYIKSNYGIHLKEEKAALVISRLSQVLMQKGHSSFAEYYQYVVSDRTGTAGTDLVNKISTNHTFFMREVEHFRYFRDTMLPYLEKMIPDRDLRLWCAGCSTGQESYTLAMLLEDYFQTRASSWDKKLLATDISSKVLEKAVRGEYPADQLEELPNHWRTRYFTSKRPNVLTVSDSIKSQVIYRRFNLMDPSFPFKKRFHAIFCRNVMIYFDNPTKEELVNKFWERTMPGGFLVISHSESLNRDRTGYKYIMPGVYRKE
jgi:chemotaxis protein methyltransferase CheR